MFLQPRFPNSQRVKKLLLQIIMRRRSQEDSQARETFQKNTWSKFLAHVPCDNYTAKKRNATNLSAVLEHFAFFFTYFPFTV